MRQAFKNEKSLVESTASESKEASLARAIELIRNPEAIKQTLEKFNKECASNPRSSLLFSTAKFAVMDAEAAVEWAKHVVEDLEHALISAKSAHHKAARSLSERQKAFELALQNLGIEANEEESEMLGYKEQE